MFKFSKDALKLKSAKFEAEKEKLSDFEKTLDKHHIVAHRTRSKEADRFRFLRTQILHTMEKHDLKTLAISRIFLDNFNNLQSSWVTQGPKIGQVSLYYGANDMGSTMMEENVVAAAGTVYCMDEEEIRRLITDGGFIPQRRNMKYDYLPH